MQWEQLAVTSHYQTAVAVREELLAGHVDQATAGIEELIDALGRSERRALKSQLIRLMTHVIKWTCQPERRSRSWALTIRNARYEIADIREDTPSLTEDVIREMWETCFQRAKEDAEDEMGERCEISRLSWDEVFDRGYAFA